MKRVSVFVLGVVALLGLSTGATAGEKARKPNILWISCEDMSPDLGCYGVKYARSPNIDKLAKQGLRFTRAFMVAGVCAPSRSAIITGMYPTSIGTHHMRSQGVPPAYVHCFTEYLRALGYFCTNNVKTDYNFESPITAWDESSAKAHWRHRRRKDQPFFAVFNITTTHESQVRLSDKEFFKKTAKVKGEDRHDPAKAELPPYYPDTPAVRQDWARYFDLITAMDLQVGELLRQLEEDGLMEDTIVFFWSDHGRGLPRAKRWLYDSGIHVPLIVRWPGRIPADSTSDDLVSSLDFAPTVISLAGGEVPKHLQGQVFLGDNKARARQYIFGVRDRMDEKYDRIRCVRDERYHYLKNFETKIPYAQHIAYMDQMPTMKEWRRLHELGQLKGPQTLFFLPEKPEEELYDTASDPHEVRNLAGSAEHRAILERLRNVLVNWQKETVDLGDLPEDKLKEKMRPGGVWAVTAAPTMNMKPGTYAKSVQIELACPTPGASIAYTLEDGPNARWLLYHESVTLREDTTLRCRACRLGYKDSPEVRGEYKITR